MIVLFILCSSVRVLRMLTRLLVVLLASVSAANLIALDEGASFQSIDLSHSIDLIWGAAFAVAFLLLWRLSNSSKRFGS